jgi:hypothetical protein
LDFHGKKEIEYLSDSEGPYATLHSGNKKKKKKKKLQHPGSVERSWSWWYVPVIPAMAGSMISEDSGPDCSRQKTRPCL